MCGPDTRRAVASGVTPILALIQPAEAGSLPASAIRMPARLAQLNHGANVRLVAGAIGAPVVMSIKQAAASIAWGTYGGLRRRQDYGSERFTNAEVSVATQVPCSAVVAQTHTASVPNRASFSAL